MLKKDMQRYLGQVVQIIYADRQGKLTQRRVKLYAIDGDYVRAYCLEKRSVRSFILDNILAVAPFINRSVV